MEPVTFNLTGAWVKLQRWPLSTSAAGIIKRRLWIKKISPPNMVLSTSTLLIVWRKMLESWLQLLMVSAVIPILKNVNPSMPLAMKDQCSMGLATQCSNQFIRKCCADRFSYHLTEQKQYQFLLSIRFNLMMYKRWIKSTLQEEKLTKFIYTLSAEQKEEQKMLKVPVHSLTPTTQIQHKEFEIVQS